MLRIGLTGGIGSGKSTVAGLFARRGALVVDADRIAREVVEPGTPGLAAVRDRFGPGVVTAEGRLDRAALGALVFADPERRRALEALTHPLIRRRTEELMAAAAPETIIVHDIPLLVEIGAAPAYHLVLAVDVAEEERVRRLVALRGFTEADARARISQQAPREVRLAVADIVVDNNGGPGDLVPRVAALWSRFTAFDAALRSGEPFPTAASPIVDPDGRWPDQARRALARLAHRLGDLLGPGATYDHVGPTAVTGLPATDVLDLQVGVRSLPDADRSAVRDVLSGLGHPRVATERPGERLHLSCDPARPVRVHLRETWSDGWRTALLERDWLRAEESARESWVASLPRDRAPLSPGEASAGRERWWSAVVDRAEAWAARTGWVPGSP